MAVRYTHPRVSWTNGNSTIQSGAKLYFYFVGTSTPKATYSDNDLSVANANPVVADANGVFGDIFLSPGQYKVILKTSDDLTLWSADPVGDSQANVDVTGTFALSGDISPAQITADQDNYNPTGLSGATVLRLNSDAARNITGLAGGADGREVRAYNVGAFNLTLKDESASSTAANRFALQADIVIAPDVGVILQYDSTSSRWRAHGGTSLDALTSNGADIASASTINLTTATGDTVDVTGTTTITAITLADGDQRRVRFTGILTLTHGASLVLPGSVNITTAAGDYAVFRGYAAGVVRCVQYQKASGVATVVSTPTFSAKATSSNQTFPAAGGTLSWGHGLGAAPFAWAVFLQNTTNEGGWVTSDPLILISHAQANTSVSAGMASYADATVVYVVIGSSGMYLPNKSTGTPFLITAGSWKIVIKAWV